MRPLRIGRNECAYSFCDKIVVTCEHLHLEDSKLALDRIELVHYGSDIVIFLCCAPGP